MRRNLLIGFLLVCVFISPIPAAICNPTNQIDSDPNIQNLDLNADTAYDLIVQAFDGEGAGDFDNGVADVMSYFDGTGSLLLQVSTGLEVSYQNATELGLYSNTEGIYQNASDAYITGAHFICRIERAFTEVMEGGITVQKYATAVSMPIPSYDLFKVIDGEYKPYRDWVMQTPTQGIFITEDLDMDGVIDSMDHYQNLWKQDDADPESYDAYSLYETFESLQMIQRPLFNQTQVNAGSTAPDIVGYESELLKSSGNELAIDATFFLTSPDGLVELSGPVVPVYDTPVVFDSRPYVDADYRIDPHGAVYWYNTNPGEDNTYELGFVFTETSFRHNTAVAVYISRDGNGKIWADTPRFQRSGDLVVPLWWLSNPADFADWGFTGVNQSQAGVFDYIRGQAMMAAAQGFSDQLNSDEFWAMTVCDVGASAVIQALAIGMGTGAVGMLAMYTAYQYFLRPGLEYLVETYSKDQAKELRKGGASDAEFDPSRLVEIGPQGLQNLLTDLGIQQSAPVEFFEQKVTFMDATPFYTALTDRGLLPEVQNGTIYRYVTVQIPEVYTDDILYGRQQDLEDFIQVLGGSFTDTVSAVTSIEADGLWDLVPGAIRLMFGHESTDQAGEFFTDWSAQDIAGRRAAHEFTYRMPQQPPSDIGRPYIASDLSLETRAQLSQTPNGRFILRLRGFTGALFDPLKVPAAAYTPSVDLAESRLAVSRGMRAFTYMADPLTNMPGLVAAADPGVNFSDPLAYEVDYGLMCLISLYQSEVEWSAENDPEIQAFQFIVASIQALTAHFAGQTMGMLRTGASLSLGQFARGALRMAATEVVVEEVGSSLATLAGMPPYFAEYVFGEWFGNLLEAKADVAADPISGIVAQLVSSAQAVVEAGESAFAQPAPGAMAAAEVTEGVAIGDSGTRIAAELAEVVRLGKEMRAARLVLPAKAPTVLGAAVARLEMAIVDASVNSRITAAARALFLGEHGVTFENYPGTLLAEHQMAVVMAAAAALHPGLGFGGLLQLADVQLLFGVGGDTGQSHHVQIAVAGEGTYTFDDAGAALFQAEGASVTAEITGDVPTWADFAANPNTRALRFVDPASQYNRISSSPIQKISSLSRFWNSIKLNVQNWGWAIRQRLFSGKYTELRNNLDLIFPILIGNNLANGQFTDLNLKNMITTYIMCTSVHNSIGIMAYAKIASEIVQNPDLTLEQKKNMIQDVFSIDKGGQSNWNLLDLMVSNMGFDMKAINPESGIYITQTTLQNQIESMRSKIDGVIKNLGKPGYITLDQFQFLNFKLIIDGITPRLDNNGDLQFLKFNLGAQFILGDQINYNELIEYIQLYYGENTNVPFDILLFSYGPDGKIHAISFYLTDKNSIDSTWRYEDIIIAQSFFDKIQFNNNPV